VIVTVAALVAATVNIDELPAWIDEGFAEMDTVGFGELVTVMVAALVIVPPMPVAVTV
jgi:hypothetical protein